MKIEIFPSILKVLFFVFGMRINLSSAGDPTVSRISYDDSPVTTFPALTIKEKVVYRLELDEPLGMDEAREKIGETPDTMRTKKEELRDELRKDTTLHVPLENDAWLIRFLRARNYDVALSYQLIKDYYEFRAKNRTEIFKDLLPSLEKDIFKQEIITVLPIRDENKRRIILIRPHKWDLETYPFIRIFRMLILLLEVGVYEPATQIAAAQIIFDVGGLSKKHVFAVDLDVAAKMKHWTLNCIPFHIENVHIINSGLLFRFAYTFFKPFFPLDIQQKIKVHQNLKSLHKDISASALPDIYSSGESSYPMFSISDEEWDIILGAQDQEYLAIDRDYGVIEADEMKLDKLDLSQNHISESIVTPQPTSIKVF